VKRYVYNGVEVVLTGQKAERKIEAKNPRTRAYSKPRVDTIYEITPADSETGSWKKWIRLEELYLIENNNENNNGQHTS